MSNMRLMNINEYEYVKKELTANDAPTGERSHLGAFLSMASAGAPLPSAPTGVWWWSGWENGSSGNDSATWLKDSLTMWE